MRPVQKKLKGTLMSYLGMLSMIALAALVIIVSSVIFGYTARKAAGQ